MGGQETMFIFVTASEMEKEGKAYILASLESLVEKYPTLILLVKIMLRKIQKLFRSLLMLYKGRAGEYLKKFETLDHTSPF